MYEVKRLTVEVEDVEDGRDSIAKECDAEVDKAVLEEQFPQVRVDLLLAQSDDGQDEHDEIYSHGCANILRLANE